MNMAPLNSLHAYQTVLFGVADPDEGNSLVLRTHTKVRLAGRRVQ